MKQVSNSQLIQLLNLILGSGGITAFILMAIALHTWWQNRSKDKKDARALEKLNESVVFWKTWLETNAAAGLSPEQLIAAKERAIKQLANFSQAWDELVNRITISSQPYGLVHHLTQSHYPLAVMCRFFFLLYWPANHSFRIWFFRFLFYFIIGVNAWGLAFSIWYSIPPFFPAVSWFNAFGLIAIRLIVMYEENRAEKFAKLMHPQERVEIENLLRFLRGG